MTFVRFSLAAASVAAALAVGALVALAAPGAVTGIARPGASAGRAVYCPAGVKPLRQNQLAAFVRTMPAARKRYFAAHRKAAARAAFVRLQTAQLNALRRALAQCA